MKYLVWLLIAWTAFKFFFCAMGALNGLDGVVKAKAGAIQATIFQACVLALLLWMVTHTAF